MSTSSQTHFGVVDQAIKSMETVEEYISVGMETTIDVAIDVVEHDKENEAGIKELRSVMSSYIKMEYDLKRFHEAVNSVKRQAANSTENIDLEVLLDRTLKEMPKNNQMELENHEKFIEMNERIYELRHPGESAVVPKSLANNSSADDDVVMTQQEVNIRCPYTGKDMQNPVRNRRCNHNYDKEGITHYIKSKGKRAKCPVAGCVNDKAIDIKDLEENKDLKKYIERLARMAGKRPRRREGKEIE